MKKSRNIFLAALFAVSCCATSIAQNFDDDKKLPKDTKSQKEYYKRKKEQDKKIAEATKAALKHQRDIQTPEVRKRMKEDAKKARIYNEHRPEPFFKRLFRKKEPRGKPNPQNTTPKPN